MPSGNGAFHSHSGIDASVAERWRDPAAPTRLAPQTWALAARLGYELPTPAASGNGQKIRAIPRGKKNLASLLGELEHLSEAETRTLIREQKS